ncbi:intestinal mucin-like protein [Hyperolius riggenbachi]|uniref:intestinal mucin-like protein n=1 Tax=Hyperolius riggenbachi TaxID=752182 RepID=UPI0035A2A66F
MPLTSITPTSTTSLSTRETSTPSSMPLTSTSSSRSTQVTSTPSSTPLSSSTLTSTISQSTQFTSTPSSTNPSGKPTTVYLTVETMTGNVLVSTSKGQSSTPKETTQIVSMTTQIIPTTCEKCINATCSGNATLQISKVYCPPVKSVVCTNGKTPKKVYNEDGCCFHLECPRCMGTNNKTKNPGETWTENCQNCFCDFDLIQIFCNAVTCPPLDSSICKKPGLKPYTKKTEDQCCSQIECQCDPTLCPPPPTCQMGYKTILGTATEGCCVTVDCRPMDVCLVNGAVYQVGQVIATNDSLCMTCTCSNIKNPKTGFNEYYCVDIPCSPAACSLGYAYKPPTSGCCGSCIQKCCIAVAPNGTLFTVQPGEIISDNCTEYTCDIRKNNFITIVTKETCPKIRKEDCESGELETTPNGCCSICKAPKSCLMHSKEIAISHNGCSAVVSVSYCNGLCPSLSEFSSTLQKMERKCNCCIETASSSFEVDLICPGHKANITFSVTYAKSCACTSVNCNV